MRTSDYAVVQRATGALSADDLSLPPSRATGPLAAAPARVPSTETPRRILIVDDEAAIRRVLQTLLSEKYDCDCASDGFEACAMATTKSYDLVVSDIRMPSMNGIELLEQIQKVSPSTVVVLITAIQDAHTTVAAMRQGAFDYILKPFNLDEIELCVRRALHHKALVEENRYYQSRLESLVVERTSSLQQENERLESSLLDLTLSYRTTLSVLTGALETRDPEAQGDSERVTAYALALAKAMGLPASEITALEQGSLLHDIGMIFVPEEILRKRGKLTDAERTAMRRHTEYGGRLLRRIGLLGEAAPVVEQHHERWDGTGYPRGLAGEAIDLKARIFAVADCIDAMTSERPYSQVRTFGDVANELLRCKGTHFDPAVVDAFFNVPVEEWEAIRSTPASHMAPVTGPLVPPSGTII